MKLDSLFCRGTFIALAFMVFSFNYQYSSFLAVGGARSAAILDEAGESYLRSISNKEDQVLEKIDEMMKNMQQMEKEKLNEKIAQMGAQLAEMKEALAASGGGESSKPIQNTAAVREASPAVTAPAVSFSHMTPIYMDMDPCEKLRSSNSSLAVITPYGADCRRRFLHELEKQPKPLSISTIIPGLAREKDSASYFPGVLKSLQNQTVPSDEVVICLSGVFDKVGVRYKHKMKDDFSDIEMRKATKYCDEAMEKFAEIYTKSPIKLICVGERLSSGRARNAAVSASTSDILAFIDSDDTAYPIRNEVVRNVFNDDLACRKATGKPPLLLLLHSHKKAHWKHHPYEKARGYGLPPTNLVLPSGWTGEQCVEQEEGLEIQHGRQILASIAGKPSSWAISEEVANGHPVIRRRAFDKVHFSSIPKGQDVILLRDLMFQLTPLEAEHSVLYIMRPLSTYYAAGNANADLRNLKKEAKEKEAKIAARGTTTQ